MITIFGLNKRVVNDLGVLYDGRIFHRVDDMGDNRTFDVVLNRNVILKTYGDGEKVVIDLGGTISTIENNDFHYVAIG